MAAVGVAACGMSVHGAGNFVPYFGGQTLLLSLYSLPKFFGVVIK